MKILTTSPLSGSLRTELSASAEVDVVVASNEPDLLREIADAEALVGGFGGGDTERFRRLMAAARRLKWVHTSSAGVDALLCPELRETGAVLTCAKGEVVGSLLAEHAFALMLALTRGLVWCARQRCWDRGGKAGREAYELRGKTLGIVGYGGAGQALARRAAAFEMEIAAVKRTPPSEAPPEPLRTLWGFDRLDDLLATSDVVASTLPGTPETREVFDEGRFRLMKRTALFINVGRGEAVQSGALLRALQEGWIAGAGLDVTDPEPLPEDSPLWQMDNVLITPHIAGNSPERAGRNRELVAENLRRFVAGQPLVNVVNPAAGY